MSTPYKAFACLPDRTKYQTLAEVEARLSYDPEALLALCAACRQKSTHRGAWNLLLLACARRLKSYLKTEELDELLKHLVEAIAKGKSPLSYLRWAVKDARKSRAASQERAADHAQEIEDNGALSVAYEGEEKTWATSAPSTDPLLRKQLLTALGHLSKSQRAIFLLDADGHTSPEIAALLEMSEGGVRVRLAEAKKILRNVLGNVSPND